MNQSLITRWLYNIKIIHDGTSRYGSLDQFISNIVIQQKYHNSVLYFGHDLWLEIYNYNLSVVYLIKSIMKAAYYISIIQYSILNFSLPHSGKQYIYISWTSLIIYSNLKKQNILLENGCIVVQNFPENCVSIHLNEQKWDTLCFLKFHLKWGSSHFIFKNNVELLKRNYFLNSMKKTWSSYLSVSIY